MNYRLLFSIIVLFFSIQSFAQITVTQADVNAYFNVGNQTVNKSDTLASQINIGNPGSFTINLTGRSFHQTTTSQSVTLASTGYANRFPGATHVVHASQTDPQSGTFESYAFYQSSASDLSVVGIMISSSFSGFSFENQINNSPISNVVKLPLTFNTNWVSDYTETQISFLNGNQTSTSSTHKTNSYVVDGYGVITTPDGRSLDVLRIKEDQRSYSQGNYDREISYTFLAKSGESFSVSNLDTTAPNSGQILAEMSWSYTGTTDIKDDVIAANDYKLLSNYPNPFNPSTKISYYLPKESNISLTVYNSLGQLVSEISSGVQLSGLHEVNFNAANLATGSYIYKLQAYSSDGKNNFTSSGKMLLIK